MKSKPKSMLKNKNMIKKFFILVIFLVHSLSASPAAVIFDYGGVLTFYDANTINTFLCQSLNMDLTKLNKLKEKIAPNESEEDFWLNYAKKKDILLPDDWVILYRKHLFDSLGKSEEMYKIVSQIKENGIAVGLLTNIEESYVKVPQEFGLFEPFDPCLLTCYMDVKKPDPAIYEQLIKTLNASPSDIIFIDDNKKNTHAAKKVGLDAILFESPNQIRMELKKRNILK